VRYYITVRVKFFNITTSKPKSYHILYPACYSRYYANTTITNINYFLDC